MIRKTDWKPLAHKIARDAEKEVSYREIVKVLPTLLSSGTSALEVARQSHVSPETADQVLGHLSEFEIVSSSTSGSNVRYGDRLYYMRSEGRPFFLYLDGLISSGSTGG